MPRRESVPAGLVALAAMKTRCCRRMTKPYDLIVIGTGTGTAATTAAMRIRAAGWRVAVIDYSPFGGTCALRGCDPKNKLIGGAEVLVTRTACRATASPATCTSTGNS